MERVRFQSLSQNLNKYMTLLAGNWSSYCRIHFMLLLAYLCADLGLLVVIKPCSYVHVTWARPGFISSYMYWSWLQEENNLVNVSSVWRVLSIFLTFHLNDPLVLTPFINCKPCTCIPCPFGTFWCPLKHTPLLCYSTTLYFNICSLVL
jgi:hypothetical protein